MIKILNLIFSFLKFILLIISFGVSFFIVISMDSRVGRSIMSSIYIFLPFVILLVLYTVNYLFHQKAVTQNIFYNITSVLVFIVINFVCYRAIFDKQMVLNEIMGYGINFSYFEDFLPFMQILIYGLIVSNIFFLISANRNMVKDSKVEVL